MNVGWVCWMQPGKQISKMSVLSGTFSALHGCGLAGKIKRLRLMTWLYLGDLAIAFQIASFTFQAWICVYICGSPATLQISYLTSVIDCYQSADRSSFTNKSVRMKGAYFTPAQQHLLNIFCLFRQLFPPAYAKHMGHVVLENTHSPRGKMASIRASWFFYRVLWRDRNGIVYVKMVNTHLTITISLSSSWVFICGGKCVYGDQVCLCGINTLQLLVTVRGNVAKLELQCSRCAMVRTHCHSGHEIVQSLLRMVVVCPVFTAACWPFLFCCSGMEWNR